MYFEIDSQYNALQMKCMELTDVTCHKLDKIRRYCDLQARPVPTNSFNLYRLLMYAAPYIQDYRIII